MSALDLKTYFEQIVDINVHGDGHEVGGEIARILSGDCVSFEDYKSSCSYLKGLNTAKAMMQQAYNELFNQPRPEEAPAKKGKK